MKNVSLRAALAAAALTAAAPAAATNGMRMIGFGPIQNSMGGVSAATGLDAATAVTNPAGLSGLAPRLDLSGTAFMPTVEYDAQWSMGNPPAAAAQESDRPIDVIPTLAGVYRVQDKVTLGFAALGTAGMGVEYPAGAAGLYGQRTFTSYMNMRVAPAAAYRVTDALSLGLTANVNYAIMSYEAGGMAKRESAGALGLGATVGAAFQVSKALTLAAAYESRSFYQEFEFDLPAHAVPTPGGPQPVPGGTEKLDFDQPQVATLGAAVRPIEGLLVAADVQWIDWSDSNGEKKPKFTTNPDLTGARAWNMDWSDQVVFKLGAQYAVPAVKGLAVRAGYNYGATPLDAKNFQANMAFPAIAEHHVTVGAGYDVGKLALNAAFVYSPEATIKHSDPALGVNAVESRMSQAAFELGGSYRF